jgi:hypothetical protein
MQETIGSTELNIPTLAGSEAPRAEKPRDVGPADEVGSARGPLRLCSGTTSLSGLGRSGSAGGVRVE